AAIGSHGETVRGLLQPGFHSGTVPRLYARLRKAERDAARTGRWHTARSYRHELDEVAHTVQRFVARELVDLLRQSTSWRGVPLAMGAVRLALHRMSFELTHAEHPARPVEVALERRGPWLVAGLPQTGWLDQLSPEQLRAFTTALAGLYKLSGIDLVQEQV